MPHRRTRTVPSAHSRTSRITRRVAATRIPGALAAAVMVCAALTAPAVAQDPERRGDPAVQDTLIPREYVRMVATGGSMPPRRLLVGTLVRPLPTLLAVPADARVVGSTRSGSSGFSVIAMPGSMAAAWMAGAAMLEASGFERASPGLRRSGFVDSRLDRQNLFCHGDSLAVRITAQEWNSQSYVLLRTMLPGAAVECAGPTGRRRLFDEAPVPALVPPVGATALSQASGGGGGAWEARALIESDLGIRELLAHYDVQLRSSGWEPGEARQGDTVGIQSYRFRDDRADEWLGILSAVRLDDFRHALEIRVLRFGDWLP